MADKQTYTTFEDYWAGVVQKPFTTWMELEETYRFVQEHAPALMTRTLAEARAEVAERAASTKELNPHGVHPDNRCRVDGINSTPIGGGTSADYTTAKIARDRPDVHERMKDGEFATVAAAAKEAGIDTRGRRLWMPVDASKAADVLFGRFSADFLRGMIRRLEERLREG